MSGVLAVTKGQTIALTVDGTERKSYVALEDGDFRVNGFFIYTVDEDTLTETQRQNLIKNMGDKVQEITTAPSLQECGEKTAVRNK